VIAVVRSVGWYDGNEVSLYCTQITKVAVFNGIGTSKERRGPLSLC
jgi:hypothetical protein